MATEYALHRFSVDEYHRLVDAGALGATPRVELLDGFIVDMSPIGFAHWRQHGRIAELFYATLGRRAFIAGQASFPLDEYNEPQPDLALLAPRWRDATTGTPPPRDIYAIVEVAASSLRTDLGPKRLLYARRGIIDYVVVDLTDDSVVHHAEPAQGDYRHVRRLRRGDALVIAAFPDTPFAADSFLAPLV